MGKTTGLGCECHFDLYSLPSLAPRVNVILLSWTTDHQTMTCKENLVHWEEVQQWLSFNVLAWCLLSSCSIFVETQARQPLSPANQQWKLYQKGSSWCTAGCNLKASVLNHGRREWTPCMSEWPKGSMWASGTQHVPDASNLLIENVTFYCRI